MHEDENIKSLIEIHKPYFRLLDDGKVQCILNNHAFPPNKDVIKAFISGKKFKKLKMRYEADEGLAKYEPFISQSLNFPNMLFCALTNQLIHKSKEAIQQHMKGRRFLTAKERFQNDTLELWAEPTPEEMKEFEEAMQAEEKELQDQQPMDVKIEGIDEENDFAVPIDVLEEQENGVVRHHGLVPSVDQEAISDDVTIAEETNGIKRKASKRASQSKANHETGNGFKSQKRKKN